MIKVDKQKLLNTRVNNDFNNTTDDFGRFCIKCAFLNAMKEYEGLSPRIIIKLYWSAIDYFRNPKETKFRKENTELIKVLDKYEQLGIKKSNFLLNNQHLVNDLVQELEEKKLVEFI